MTNQEILEIASNKNLEEIDRLIYLLRDMRSSKFNSMYKVVEVYPGNRIEKEITKATGFHCYHTRGDTISSRGTHTIVIPIADYSTQLETELKTKFNQEQVIF